MLRLISALFLAAGIALLLSNSAGIFLGPLIIFIGLGSLFAIGFPRYPLLAKPEFAATRAFIAILISSHFLVFVLSLQFFHVPAGSQIRPMGWAFLIADVAFFTFVTAFPLVVISIRKEKQEGLGALGFLCSFTPFFFGGLILGVAAKWNNFELSP